MKPMRDVKAIVRAGCVADLVGRAGHRGDGLVVVSEVDEYVRRLEVLRETMIGV